ncbi:MAG: NUDIX hydrolase [Porticoccaceae bacterium]
MSNTELHYAATVILVRDCTRGVEVLMLERSGKSESFGGAFVFPGGKVDLHDAHRDYATLYSGHTDEDASQILKVPQYGLAYWTGGIRECFEEVGILLAYDQRGEMVSFRDSAVKQRFAAHRDSLNRGEKNLLEICREEHLRLATDQMYYYSHWVTPVPMPRRFDTRFFVCPVPPHQEPIIDNHEAVSQCWINPAEALRRGKEGSLQIFFPTIRNLVGIAGFDDTRSLLLAVAASRDIPRILPLRVTAEDGKDSVLLPGDDGYRYHEIAKTHY